MMQLKSMYNDDEIMGYIKDTAFFVPDVNDYNDIMNSFNRGLNVCNTSSNYRYFLSIVNYARYKIHHSEVVCAYGETLVESRLNMYALNAAHNSKALIGFLAKSSTGRDMYVFVDLINSSVDTVTIKENNNMVVAAYNSEMSTSKTGYVGVPFGIRRCDELHDGTSEKYDNIGIDGKNYRYNKIAMHTLLMLVQEYINSVGIEVKDGLLVKSEIQVEIGYERAAYTVVNHMNGCKNDNRLENLERCTQGDNILHGKLTNTVIRIAYKSGLAVDNPVMFTELHVVNGREVAKLTVSVSVDDIYLYDRDNPGFIDMLNKISNKTGYSKELDYILTDFMSRYFI